MKSLLFVDDEPLIVNAAKIILTTLLYKVYAFSSSYEACQSIKAGKPLLDCVIFDTCMPDLSGQELYEQIEPFYPKLPVIFTSGFDLELGNRLQTKTNCIFILKPFRFEEIVNAIESLTS